MIGDLGNPSHQFEERVGAGDGNPAQFLGDLGLDLGKKGGILEVQIDEVHALGLSLN